LYVTNKVRQIFEWKRFNLKCIYFHLTPLANYESIVYYFSFEIINFDSNFWDGYYVYLHGLALYCVTDWETSTKLSLKNRVYHPIDIDRNYTNESQETCSILHTFDFVDLKDVNKCHWFDINSQEIFRVFRAVGVTVYTRYDY